MRQFILTGLAVVAMGLLTATTAEASGHGHSGHHGGHGQLHNYHLAHGKKFSHGYYYPGHNHRHWTYTTWNPTYRTRFYWDPSASAWYYWSPKQEIYYPVSYIETAPPMVEKAPATTVIVNVSSGALPAAPAGSGSVQPFVPPSE